MSRLPHCLQVEAEEFAELSLEYEVAAVPTFIFLKVRVMFCFCDIAIIHWHHTSSQGGKVVDRINGAHVPELTKKTAAHSQTLAVPPPSAPSLEDSRPTPPKEACHP